MGDTASLRKQVDALARELSEERATAQALQEALAQSEATLAGLRRVHAETVQRCHSNRDHVEALAHALTTEQAVTGALREALGDRSALADAWDEGLSLGADLGLAIGERIAGIRPEWPPVPSNPYRTTVH